MDMEALKEYGDKVGAYADQVLQANPDIHPLTATVIASDLYSAERATKELEAGLITADQAVWTTGSYARWNLVRALMLVGQLDEAWLDENILRLWQGCDPDDTDPENLVIWQMARNRHGGMLRDGRPLPQGARGTIHSVRVYRGGPPVTGTRNGIAWTTDPKIAQRFANGAGERVQRTNGVVIEGYVHDSKVLAYITGRNESEVIVEPKDVREAHVIGTPHWDGAVSR
jgi:hypothetical protein